jgi:hypothetical protein
VTRLDRAIGDLGLTVPPEATEDERLGIVLAEMEARRRITETRLLIALEGIAPALRVLRSSGVFLNPGDYAATAAAILADTLKRLRD